MPRASWLVGWLPTRPIATNVAVIAATPPEIIRFRQGLVVIWWESCPSATTHRGEYSNKSGSPSLDRRQHHRLRAPVERRVRQDLAGIVDADGAGQLQRRLQRVGRVDELLEVERLVAGEPDRGDVVRILALGAAADDDAVIVDGERIAVAEEVGDVAEAGPAVLGRPLHGVHAAADGG